MQVGLALNYIISCVFCELFFLCSVSDNHAISKQKVYDGTFMPHLIHLEACIKGRHA